MRHRPKGEGLGAGRRRYADNTAFALSPKGLALTQWGPQAPLQQRKFSDRLSIRFFAQGIVTRRAKTPLPDLHPRGGFGRRPAPSGPPSKAQSGDPPDAPGPRLDHRCNQWLLRTRQGSHGAAGVAQ